MSLPEPLVPAELDIRMLNSFMLDTKRLLGSALWAIATGDQAKAAITLWCRAWHEVPAGSLPDDDAVLAGYSGLGKMWRKNRDVALRGFIKCADGRFYHPVLCQDALRAWREHQKHVSKRDADRERLNDWRDKKRERRQRETQPETHGETRFTRRFETSDETDGVASKTGTETGNESGGGVGRARTHEAVDLIAEACISLVPQTRNPAGLIAGSRGIVREWLESGADPERDIYPTIKQLLIAEPHPSTLKFFTKAIARAKRDRDRTAEEFSHAADAPRPVQRNGAAVRRSAHERQSTAFALVASEDADEPPALGRVSHGAA